MIIAQLGGGRTQYLFFSRLVLTTRPWSTVNNLDFLWSDRESVPPGDVTCRHTGADFFSVIVH